MTEFEIDAGLTQISTPNDSCLCFTRRFQGLDNDAAQSNFAAAQRYIELKYQHSKV